MRRALGGIAALVGIGALAGALILGSHALRAVDPTATPSVSPSPVSQVCVSADRCEAPAAECVPGEGVSCDSSPAPYSPPAPTPTESESKPPTTRGPAGTIQASWWLSIVGDGPNARIGVLVTVLYDTDYVAGADVSLRCSGASFEFSLSGTTASRASWSQTSNPSIPTGPAAFLWAVDTVNIAPGTGSSARCHGTASYNGMSDSF
jgi:hypothetical protein